MAKDLKKELPDTDGFSRTNLFAMRKFHLFYKESPIVHQLGGQFLITPKTHYTEKRGTNSEVVNPFLPQ